MTVIYLGANDFSSSMAPSYDKFYKDYVRLMGYVKANYGEDHPILCAVPPQRMGNLPLVEISSYAFKKSL